MANTLTKVVLKYQADRRRISLLYGRPFHFKETGNEEEIFFKPHEIFVLEDWQANEYGTISWKIYILKSVSPGEPLNRVAYVFPGAEILIKAQGKRKVAQLKAWLEGLVLEGHDPTKLSTEYFRSSQSKMRVHLQPRKLGQPHGKILNLLKNEGR